MLAVSTSVVQAITWVAISYAVTLVTVVSIGPGVLWLQRLGFERRNYRGRRVISGAGVLLVAPLLLGNGLAAMAGLLDGSLALLMSLGFVLLVLTGMLDDFRCDAAKGLTGHLQAWFGGQPTSGLAKLLAALLYGLSVAAIQRRSLIEASLVAVLVALSANFLNLTDLRPGRALKVFLLLGGALLLLGGRHFLVLLLALGPAVALLPLDLGERTMLGDTGANPLGAFLGSAAVLSLGLGWQLLLTLALLLIHLWAERNSLTGFIARSKVLRAFDQLGRLSDEQD